MTNQPTYTPPPDDQAQLDALGGFPALAVRKPPGQPRGISFLRRR